MAELPLARLPKLQMTVVAPEHDPCVGLAEMKVAPAGSVSVNVEFMAGDGPVFATTIL